MREMIKWTKTYFIIWWIPVVVNFLAIGIFFCGVLLRRDWIIDFSLVVFFVNLVGTIVSSIVQIVIRKWYFIFLQLGMAAFLLFYLGLIFTYSPPDYYGAHKEIPDHIEFSTPLDSITNPIDFEKHEFILVNSFQPGIYRYYTNHSPTELGFFYIKVFEINCQDKLSEKRIKETSKISVDQIIMQNREGKFTIYEGDWGDKYGSRIELWYQPDNEKEYKVEERNFIVEGWQR